MRYFATLIALVLCLTSNLQAQRPGPANARGTSRPTPNARPTLPIRPSPRASVGSVSRRGSLTRLRQLDRQRMGLRDNRGPQVNRPQARATRSELRNPSVEDQVPSDAFSRLPSNRSSRNQRPPRRVSGAEQALQQRLASIDKMRDFAVESGNMQLLDRADALERLAREQHGHMLQQIAQRDTTPSGPSGNPENVNGRPRADQTPYVMSQRQPAESRIPDRDLSQRPQVAGREFGQMTARQARELGRDFGQANAENRPLTPQQRLPRPVPMQTVAPRVQTLQLPLQTAPSVTPQP